MRDTVNTKHITTDLFSRIHNAIAGADVLLRRIGPGAPNETEAEELRQDIEALRQDILQLQTRFVYGD